MSTTNKSDVPGGVPTLPAPRPRRWFAFVALGIAAVAFLFITLGGIGENLVYYWAPTDVHAAGKKAVGATIRLGGQVGAGTVVYGDGVSKLEFDVVDGKSSVHVKATGMPPQMFRDRIGVVVEGTMTSAGYFEGHKLMVSHDNKYRAPGDKDVDIKELMRSTQGLEGSGEDKGASAKAASGEEAAK
jgi:cytochrome c-type biogenesis protein CcmE